MRKIIIVSLWTLLIAFIALAVSMEILMTHNGDLEKINDADAFLVLATTAYALAVTVVLGANNYLPFLHKTASPIAIGEQTDPAATEGRP